MGHDSGRLLPSDEQLNHQIVATFATVAESDFAWTEKMWASGFAPACSLQIDAALGKSPNRNVLDGFGGVSRGVEQWTVRASRELHRDPESTEVGPLRYEVTEPLRAIRFALDATDVVPVAFDFTLTGLLPPIFAGARPPVGQSRHAR